MNSEPLTFLELKQRLAINFQDSHIDFAREENDFRVIFQRGLTYEITCWRNGSLKKITWAKDRIWDPLKKKWKSTRSGWAFEFCYHDCEHFIGPMELPDGRIVFMTATQHFVLYPQRYGVSDTPPYIGDLQRLRSQFTRFPSLTKVILRTRKRQM
jgi:hypothetical protein